jgi:lysophospholipase I
MKMPGWYDIISFEDRTQKSFDEPGILKSRDYFNDLIQKEVEQTGVASNRMLLGMITYIINRQQG